MKIAKILLSILLPAFLSGNSSLSLANSTKNKELNMPKAFSHIGITVPDLEKAVKFYTEVLGLYVIMEPTTIQEDDSAIGQMCKDVFGEGFGSFRIAHLATIDKIGIEIFEFNERRIARLSAEEKIPSLRKADLV